MSQSYVSCRAELNSADFRPQMTSQAATMMVKRKKDVCIVYAVDAEAVAGFHCAGADASTLHGLWVDEWKDKGTKGGGYRYVNEGKSTSKL